MVVAMLPPLLSPPLHGGAFTWDEWICTGLVALILVIGAFVVLRFEKEGKQDAPAQAERPTKE